MRMFTKAAFALMVAGTSLSATAQTAPPPPPPEAKTQAMAYVMAAGMSDMFEINSSQVAVQKSRTSAVRSYANMLIKHHTKTTAATMKAARKAGMNPPPPMLDPGAAASIAELQAAGPDDFDRVYLAQQVPAHQAALDLHSSYAGQGDQPALRASARSAVPIVRQHLTAAERMQRGRGHSGHSGM
jgi:putative membrane protein